MSQITIQLSDKADALIAQLQKEIFNRRRKKVSAAGVVETLVESGAKSQSDKRFSTSWKNLIADIEKAAKVAHAHGAKPANLSDEEWAMVLNHRTRAGTRTVVKKPVAKKPVPKTAVPKQAVPKQAVPKKAVAKPAAATKRVAGKPAARQSVAKKGRTATTGTSVAKRMAKAVSRLSTNPQVASASSANGANGTGALVGAP
jgi:topoisomerase IA-like protein